MLALLVLQHLFSCAPVTASSETTMVVVATHDLARGEVIGEEDVTTVDVPAALVAGRDTLLVEDHAIGRTPTNGILAGEILRGERLARRDGSSGLSAVTAPGKVHLALELSSAEALAPLLIPDSYVDVLATHQGPGKGTSRMLVQGVRVTAVNGVMGTDAIDWSGTSHVVMLHLGRPEAQLVAAAAASSQVRLAQRSDVDIIQYELNDVAFDLGSELE
jgi:pilus assembly protein CpaB